MLVGPFWEIFLTRWDPFLAIYVTISKLALVAKWCLAGDFSQGTTVTILCRPQLGIDPRIDMDPHLLVILELMWAPICHWAHNS